MAKNNGHWYTDKNGNHYFVEDGQTPQEGWEASKRRKMISGGKYMTSEDGNDYSEVDKDKYDAYEADEADFDENEEDDFGFDEEDDFTQTVNEMKDDNVNLDDPREVMQYLGANMGLDREDQVRFMERLGYSVNDIEKLRNPDDDFEDEDNFDFTEAEERQIDKYAEHYGADANAMKKSIYAKAQEYMKGDNMGDEEAYDKAMEEVLDEVANGEYNREMKKAQEENAKLSEGGDENNAVQGSQNESTGNRLRFKLPNQEEQVGTIENVNENGTNAFGKKQKLYTVRTPDGRRIEVNSDYVIKPEYPGGTGDYVYNQQNPEYGEDNRRHNPTPNQKKAAMADRIKENDDPIYSHFRNKFGVSDKDLDDLRGYDYDISKYKDNSKLTWRDPVESWADPVKDFAKEHNVSEDDVREFLNRAYDRTNKGPLKDGTDVYGSQPTGTQVFNNLKKYVDSLPDEQKEMLKDLLNNPRK